MPPDAQPTSIANPVQPATTNIGAAEAGAGLGAETEAGAGAGAGTVEAGPGMAGPGPGAGAQTPSFYPQSYWTSHMGMGPPARVTMTFQTRGIASASDPLNVVSQMRGTTDPHVRGFPVPHSGAISQGDLMSTGRPIYDC